ncbi:MAG: D-alanyl-D-alanine carboxypeptidase family protein [Firmicutes bacterium]|nr:D-alanyl-D-alanine carboxypeptidase family protein [Bacillota bacterium]
MNHTIGKYGYLLAALAFSAVLLTGCGAKQEEPKVVIENPKYLNETEAPAFEKTPAETVSAAAAKPDEAPAAQAPKEEPAPEPAPIDAGNSRAQSEEAKALVVRASSMQSYDHAEGEDAPAVSVVDDNLLLLINKTHPLSSDYKADDLQTVAKFTAGVGTDETHQMRRVAAEALQRLFEGAEKDGYDIRLRTGYRSYSYQSTLYNNYVKNNGKEAADRFSAQPGESEHQTGLCCDVGVTGVSLTGFNTRDEAVWIAAHAHEYGFILRYPEGKEDITGYMYESWHIRYVGEVIAKEIFEQGLTLEEYLGVTD